MENRIYFSTMTPPLSGGGFSFSLQTFDSGYSPVNTEYDAEIIDETDGIATYFPYPNVTITGNVTGLLPTDSESDICYKLSTQISIIIDQNGYTFHGNPNSVAGGPKPFFRVTRTDHVMSIFSECQFDFDVSADTTGGIYLNQATPVLCTVAFARTFGKFTAQNWVDPVTFAPFSDQDVANSLSAASADFVAETLNEIILSNYIHEIDCRGTSGTYTKHRPIQYLDAPYIQRPDIYSFLSSVSPEPMTPYFQGWENGFLDYRFHQDMLMAYEPFDEGNIFRLAYVAGEKKIPDIIQQCIVRLTLLQTVNPLFTEIQGGTSRAKFVDIYKLRREFLLPCRKWFRGGMY
jgi:hypothetical protein